MKVKSYTRVTLALDIVKKIQEGQFAGYHELGIIKHKIDLYDNIEISDSEEMAITCDNPLVPCDSSNICWKATLLLKERFGIRSNVKINIEKHIPVMGGLAGGSANAATTLSALSAYWNLNLSMNDLVSFGRLLGMDVPFYFTSDTAFDTEATGVIRPIRHTTAFTFVLAIPDFGVSTKDAYQGIDYNLIGKSVDRTQLLEESLLRNDPVSVYPLMHNDFELTVFKKNPALEALKKQLAEKGCLASVMSGSGSTVIGIAESLKHAEAIKNDLNCKVLIATSHFEM
ncbi:MAG: 4-(cytidine 5'-diphospho)-2-C-methyl-D-erythritol kinase [Fibrobacter sp.]|nr:4-(cytidine 5'-diphospho)-2-C-methyl-D-erythritol kinase [Fibrobacter sp.]